LDAEDSPIRSDQHVALSADLGYSFAANFHAPTSDIPLFCITQNQCALHRSVRGNKVQGPRVLVV
jgi:hypothetical protein